MPKRVDHEERHRRIAEALWRIAGARGLDGVGLRDIAAEAGISLGQLQHYFASKDEMLVVTLDHLSAVADRRIRERLGGLPTAPSPRRVLHEVAAELLPLDAKRRSGNLVQVAYFARAVHHERLRRHAQQGIPALCALFAAQLREAVARGEVAEGIDPDGEAMVLYALTDGLMSTTLLGVIPPEEALRLVDAHLDRLFVDQDTP